MPRNTVRTWMTPHPITIHPSDSVLQAYALMKHHRIRRLPVLKDDHLIGIITINDVRSAAPMGNFSLLEHNEYLSGLRVEDVMTTNPLTIEASAHVSEAARLMMKHKFGGMPVTENDRLVGVISEADIFRRTIAEAWAPNDDQALMEGEEHITLLDGTEVQIRPITQEDAERLQASHERLSQETVYDRFMAFRKILPEAELRYLTGLDYDSHMALIATSKEKDEENIVGVARYILLDSEPGTAEFAIVISDPFQRRGLGSLLMQRLAAYAAAHNVKVFLGLTHNDNLRFLRFVQQLGLPVETKKKQGVWEVRLSLSGLQKPNIP